MTHLCFFIVLFLSYAYIAHFINGAAIGDAHGKSSMTLRNELCTMKQQSKDNTTVISRHFKIIVATNTQYFSIFLNWLLYYHRLCKTTDLLYIICLDTETKGKLKHLGLQCSHTHSLPSVAPFNRLWTVRTQLSLKLLEEGYDVILTDTDALWLRNPFPELQRYPQSDIIGSRAKFPENVYEFYGSTLCMGFVYIKSNNLTIPLWSELSAKLSRSKQPDDQKFINELLMRGRMNFPQRMTYLKNEHSDTGTFSFQRQDYLITLLAQHEFRRSCELNQNEKIQRSIIAHCATFQKAEKMKKIAGEVHGLWALNASWENLIQTTQSLPEKLHSLNISVVDFL